MTEKRKLKRKKLPPVGHAPAEGKLFCMPMGQKKTEKPQPFGLVQLYRLRYSTRGLPPVE